MKNIIQFIKKIYSGKTSRIAYILFLLLGVLLLFPIFFGVIMITLGIFGPSTVQHYPALAFIPIGAVVILFSIYLHILHVRRLHDIGNTSDTLLYRSIPGGNLLVEGFMLFAKGKHKYTSKQTNHHQTEKFLLILSIFGTIGIFFSLFTLKTSQGITNYPPYYSSFSLLISILNLVGLFSLWRWKKWGIYFFFITSGLNIIMDYIFFRQTPIVFIALVVIWGSLLIWYTQMYKRAYLQ